MELASYIHLSSSYGPVFQYWTLYVYKRFDQIYLPPLEVCDLVQLVELLPPLGRMVGSPQIAVGKAFQPTE